MMQYVVLLLKGLAMGAANVIPGVSGGTIALITGIYERLINGIKSFDLTAIRFLFTGKWKQFWEHIDGSFLMAVFAGVGISVISLAKLLEFLLDKHEQATMAFFFGLILLSVFSVGKTIHKWDTGTIIALVIGTAIAVGIALLAPASENPAFFYVFLCGIVAICSMILPGLSGSFVLIIMGNYALVLGAVGRADTDILLPLMLGCVAGLVAFSHILAWVFKHYRDQTIGLMTGFILGSLTIIWPWKETVKETIIRDGKPPKEVVVSYEWVMPDIGVSQTWMGVGLIFAGMLAIWLIERAAMGQHDTPAT